MLKTILTPVDGSAHARAALNLSIALAKAYDAKLLILHVGMRDGSPPERLYETASSKLGEAEERGEETGIYPHLNRHLRVMEYLGRMVLQSSEQAAELKGVKQVETAIDFGDAGERILHHAKQGAADLIVMGSRGYNELEGLFLGSVSHKVFHLAPCTCITVHQADDTPSFQGFKSIVVAVDGSEHSARALELASDFAAKYDSKLVLLHALRGDESVMQLRAVVDPDQLSESTREELERALQPIPSSFGGGLAPPIVSEDALKDIGNRILKQSEAVASAKNVRRVETRLVDDDPAGAILETAREVRADLIALGSRGLGEVEGILSGSVSYKVNHAAPCSCMVVY